MRIVSRVSCGFFCLAIAFGTTGIPVEGLAGETRAITATPRLTWKSDQGESKTDGTPLIVEVQRGDIVEFSVPQHPIPHGVVTIKIGDDNAKTVAKEFVWACGQAESDVTKNAGLREIDCTGAPSVFGDEEGFEGTLKLEVTDKFNDDISFWCTVHEGRMWGTLKLKP